MMKFNDNDCSLTIEFFTEGKQFINWFEYLKDAHLYTNFAWDDNEEQIAKIKTISVSSDKIEILKFHIEFDNPFKYSAIRDLMDIKASFSYSKKGDCYIFNKLTLEDIPF